MINVDLRGDTKAIEKVLRDIKGGTSTVVFRSINRTLTPVRATAAREIAKDMKVKVGTARSALKLVRATRARLTGEVQASGRRIPLIQFGARPTPPGVSYDLGRGRSVARGAFIKPMPTGYRGAFRRRSRARLPIVELKGPSVPKVFVAEKISAAMRTVARARWLKEVSAQIRFLLSQGRGT